MDFQLSDAQHALRASAAKSAQRIVQATNTDQANPREIWRLWGDEGWLGLCVPEMLAGRGLSALDTVLAYEALGRAGVARGQLFAVGAHLFGCAMAIANHGSAGQQGLWSRRLTNGEAIGALAFTEPAGGSSLSTCDTMLDPDGRDYRLTGRKVLVSNGAQADVFVVLASLGATSAPFNLVALLLPCDTPGVEVIPIETATGLTETRPAEIVMADCPVPADALLGRPGGGLGILLSVMRWERSCILAGLLGALERDLVAVTGHLDRRGGPAGAVSRHQAVAHGLARVRTKIETARWLMYRAAWEIDHGCDALSFPAMSKLTVSETMVECAMELRTLAAGMAWTGELGLVRALDDVVGTLSASGTSYVQLNTIASQLERG